MQVGPGGADISDLPGVRELVLPHAPLDGGPGANNAWRTGQKRRTPRHRAIVGQHGTDTQAFDSHKPQDSQRTHRPGPSGTFLQCLAEY